MKQINDASIVLVEEKARQIRRDIIQMLSQAGSGHTGGSLRLLI